jgi:RHS repeat-associated protein
MGSARLISNADREEYERMEYTPYGEVWIEKASTASNIDIPWRFTGKERDDETGLYYYGARYLDSRTGRWLSTDPALGDYIPGAPVNDEARRRNGSLPGMGGVFNTVNLHLYHYAGNNPVKYVDQDGRWIAFKKQAGRFNSYLRSNLESGLNINDAYKFAENRDAEDLIGHGYFSEDVSNAIATLRLGDGEWPSYMTEEYARYEAFKDIRKNISDTKEGREEIGKILREASSAYFVRLNEEGGTYHWRQEKADEEANKIIDTFIQSKNVSYQNSDNEVIK